MKRRHLTGLAVRAAVAGLLPLRQRERATGDGSRWPKPSAIQDAQSACPVQGRSHDARWLRHFYTCLAPVYDRAQRKSPGYWQAVRDLIARLEIGAEDTALDVGCGTGLLTLPLAERARWTVGLDLSSAMLKMADKATRLGLSVALCEGNALNLPFADGEFVVVATGFMLHHLSLEQKQCALVEIHRVLAAGGRLGCLSCQREIAGALPTREAWEGLLREADFSGVQIEERYDVFRLVTARKGT